MPILPDGGGSSHASILWRAAFRPIRESDTIAAL